jgi:hypothetical protein
VYRSPYVAVDALRVALNMARATFTAVSVGVVWKVCGPAECNTPPSPTERLVRFMRSPGGGSGVTSCLGDALIDLPRGQHCDPQLL